MVTNCHHTSPTDANLTVPAVGEIGISGATLSHWLKGAYASDNEAVAAKVGRWLDARAERNRLEAALPAVPEGAETPTARRVLGALWYAQLAGDIAVVYGGAGSAASVTVGAVMGRRARLPRPDEGPA